MEGEALTFNVTLGVAVQRGLTVTPAFTDGTAEKGLDYTENTEALRFAGRLGEVQSFTVATLEDELIEGDETFTVTPVAAGGSSTVSGTGATGTILNDDAAAASVSDASADEGETLVFKVTLDKAAVAGTRVTLNYATEDGTATAGEDYVPRYPAR